MCILFCNQLRGWDGRNGRVGRESLFAIGTDGNLKKKKITKKEEKNKTLYTHYKRSSAFLVSLMSQASNSLITKLDSFIYKDMQVYEAGSASNHHQLHLH